MNEYNKMGFLKVLTLFICVGGGGGLGIFCNIMIVLFVKDMPAQVTYSVATRLIAIIVSVCEIISSCVSI